MSGIHTPVIDLTIDDEVNSYIPTSIPPSPFPYHMVRSDNIISVDLTIDNPPSTNKGTKILSRKRQSESSSDTITISVPESASAARTRNTIPPGPPVPSQSAAEQRSIVASLGTLGKEPVAKKGTKTQSRKRQRESSSDTATISVPDSVFSARTRNTIPPGPPVPSQSAPEQRSIVASLGTLGKEPVAKKGRGRPPTRKQQRESSGDTATISVPDSASAARTRNNTPPGPPVPSQSAAEQPSIVASLGTLGKEPVAKKGRGRPPTRKQQRESSCDTVTISVPDSASAARTRNNTPPGPPVPSQSAAEQPSVVASGRNSDSSSSSSVTVATAKPIVRKISPEPIVNYPGAAYLIPWSDERSRRAYEALEQDVLKKKRPVSLPNATFPPQLNGEPVSEEYETDIFMDLLNALRDDGTQFLDAEVAILLYGNMVPPIFLSSLVKLVLETIDSSDRDSVEQWEYRQETLHAVLFHMSRSHIKHKTLLHWRPDIDVLYDAVSQLSLRATNGEKITPAHLLFLDILTQRYGETTVDKRSLTPLDCHDRATKLLAAAQGCFRGVESRDPEISSCCSKIIAAIVKAVWLPIFYASSPERKGSRIVGANVVGIFSHCGIKGNDMNILISCSDYDLMGKYMHISV